MPEAKLGDLSIELEPALGTLLLEAFDDVRDSVVAATGALWRYREPHQSVHVRGASLEFQKVARAMLHAAKRMHALATDDIRDDLLSARAQKAIAVNAGLPGWLIDQITDALNGTDDDHAALTAVAKHFDIDYDPPEETA